MPLPSDIDAVLDPVLAHFQGVLEMELAGEIAEAYLRGDAQMMAWGRTKAKIPIAYEGPPIQRAVDWSAKHAARLVTEMAEETKRKLAKVISDGIKNKRGIPGLARDIRGQIGQMTKYRSELIAKTETANALGEAFTDRGNAMGITGKRWVTIGDDKVSDGCLENEAARDIPFNQAFPSGDMTPPRFPGCRCAAAPVMLGKE
jgi:uncharacterized protein with gpF-like domain